MLCAKFQAAICKTVDFIRAQSHRASQPIPPPIMAPQIMPPIIGLNKEWCAFQHNAILLIPIQKPKKIPRMP